MYVVGLSTLLGLQLHDAFGHQGSERFVVQVGHFSACLRLRARMAQACAGDASLAFKHGSPTQI